MCVAKLNIKYAILAINAPVHVSYKKEINSNRKEYLMAIKNSSGKTEYKPILGLSTDRYVK